MNVPQQARRSFGDWLRQRRRALDLTQEEFARRVGCSVVTMRKLEAETRRPSKQIALRLAKVLEIGPDDEAAFLKFARGDPFSHPRHSAAPRAPEFAARAPLGNLPISLNSFI